MNCRSLKILNIDQFNVSLVENYEYMFGECSSLISLNLSSFSSIPNSANLNDMFYNCNQNLKYCINDNLIYNDEFIDTLKIFKKNCSDICITMNNKKYIKEKYLCIDDCSLDSEYKYDYNNICYKKNPEEKSSNTKKSYGFIIAGGFVLIIIIVISIYLLKKNKKLCFENKSNVLLQEEYIKNKIEADPDAMNTELVEKNKSIL